MSDIAINISWFDLLLASPIFGWPGLIAGGLLGAVVFKRRRILAGSIGAAIGCVVWFGASLMLK